MNIYVFERIEKTAKKYNNFYGKEKKHKHTYNFNIFNTTTMIL